MPYEPARMETPFRLLKRSDLHTLLLDAVRTMPNIRLLVGRGVEEASEDEAGISVRLSGQNGQAETIHGLGLIGADGLWSCVRDLTGDASPPTFTGYEAWRTTVPARPGDKPRVTPISDPAAMRCIIRWQPAARSTSSWCVRRRPPAKAGRAKATAPS